MQTLGGPLTEEDSRAIEEKGLVNGNPIDEKEPEEETKLREAYKKLYETQNNKDAKPDELRAAQTALQTALAEHGTAALKKNKENVDAMAKMSNKEKRVWITSMIKDANEQLELLKDGLKHYNKADIAVPAVQDVATQAGDGRELVKVNYSGAEDRWADSRKAPFPLKEMPPSHANFLSSR